MQVTSCDGSRYRSERLKKTLRIALAIAGLTEGQAEKLITSVRDDHGALVVSWECFPSEAQCLAFRSAWKICGESWDAVTHHSVGV